MKGTLATLRAAKGRRTDRGRGGRSGMRHRAAGVDRGLGSRLRDRRHKTQRPAVEAGRKVHLTRWTGNPRLENKEGDWVH